MRLEIGGLKDSANSNLCSTFLSTVIVVGMVISILSPKNGIINSLLSSLGIEPIYFMTEPKWFKTIFVCQVFGRTQDGAP